MTVQEIGKQAESQQEGMRADPSPTAHSHPTYLPALSLVQKNSCHAVIMLKLDRTNSANSAPGCHPDALQITITPAKGINHNRSPAALGRQAQRDYRARIVLRHTVACIMTTWLP
jgi:hypothetical protein